MNNVSFNPGVASVNFQSNADKVENTNLLKEEAPADSFEFQHKNGGAKLSTEDKQAVLQKAKTKAAGWSVFTSFGATLYYGMRSDKTVAKKFDLDVDKDKAFIKQIKREQMKSTLPSVILPSCGGLISWLYNKNRDASELEVK